MRRYAHYYLLGVLALATANANADTEGLQNEGLGLIAQFAGQLKPALVKAMSEGGPVAAVAICSAKAPEIARQLSDSSGWSIRRVSLKTRNATAATPDEWERKVLARFDALAAQGDPIPVVSQVVDGEYRLMKAQLVEGLCLACHGDNLSPDLVTALSEHYTQDTATGYKIGDVRGAFSLRKPL